MIHRNYSGPESDLMNQEQTLAAILHSEELPTLPVIASDIITLTTGKESTLSDIDHLLANDTDLSAKILKVSNSTFYSFPQQISSIKQALSILGIKAIRDLVLSFSFLTMKAGKKRGHFNFENFWNRSLAGAVAAKLILERVKGADSEDICLRTVAESRRTDPCQDLCRRIRRGVKKD